MQQSGLGHQRLGGDLRTEQVADRRGVGHAVAHLRSAVGKDHAGARQNPAGTGTTPQGGEHGREKVGRHLIVRIKKGHVTACHCAQSAIACRIGAGPWLVEQAGLEKTGRMRLQPVCRHRTTVVGRAVVDHNEQHGGMCLRGHRIEAAHDHAGTVAHGHNDGDRRHRGRRYFAVRGGNGFDSGEARRGSGGEHEKTGKRDGK